MRENLFERLGMLDEGFSGKSRNRLRVRGLETVAKAEPSACPSV
jgi:hypothetical protein